MKEFGIENKYNQLNCFLNVCLQTLWQLPSVRPHLKNLKSDNLVV